MTKDNVSEIEYKEVKMEIKSIHEDEEDKDFIGTFKALASTFGNIDLDDDVIMPGAFDLVLSQMRKDKIMPKALMQHNPRADQGAIFTNIQATEKGLEVEGKFINTTRGRDLRVEVKTGAIDSMSIGFRIGLAEFDNERGLRKILIIDKLPEISFVTFPSNPKAKVTEAKDLTIRDAEKALKEIGFSQKESKTILSKGFKDASGCDVHDEDCDGLIKFDSSLDVLIKNLKGE